MSYNLDITIFNGSTRVRSIPQTDIKFFYAF